jgi:hypothetical protein
MRASVQNSLAYANIIHSDAHVACDVFSVLSAPLVLLGVSYSQTSLSVLLVLLTVAQKGFRPL